MKTQTTTVHNISPEDFKNEIVTEIKKELQKLALTIETPPPEELIDSDVACSILGISKPTLLSYRKLGIIPFYKLGRKIRFKKSEVYNSLQLIKSKK